MKLTPDQITVGLDPEVFVQKKGKPIPVFGLLGGTKCKPRLIDIGAVQEDNAMAEFNIPPAKTLEEFINSTQTMLGVVEKLLEQQGCSTLLKPWVKFDWDLLDSPQALDIGCKPDINAYTSEKNPTVEADAMGAYRCGSCHVHVGWPNADDDAESRIWVVRAMDAFLGLQAIQWEDDVIRRQWYGRAGAFRPKPYGVEYRVLDNSPLKDMSRMKFVFRAAKRAAMQWKAYKNWTHNGAVLDVIQEIINEGDKNMAKKYLYSINSQIKSQ